MQPLAGITTAIAKSWPLPRFALGSGAFAITSYNKVRSRRFEW
jgi:hypothetical protein